MASFWRWGVRYPAIVLAVLAVFSGAAGFVEWGLGLVVAAWLWLIAYIARHLKLMARKRQERDINVRIAEERARRIRQRSDELKAREGSVRRAA